MSLFTDLKEILTPYAQRIKEKADKSTTYTKTEVDNLISEVEVETDPTLGVPGAPADAAETGRQIGLINESLESLGMSDDIKAALLACFDNVAWSGNDGESYYDDLKGALEGNLHMVFSSGISLGSGTHMTPSDAEHYNDRITARNYTAARAAAKHPIRNKGYVYTVTDATKYNLCIQDIKSMEKIPIVASANRPDDFGYLTDTYSSNWTTSARSTGSYIWLFLKKLDGTEFTEQELANEAAAVFTYAEPST